MAEKHASSASKGKWDAVILWMEGFFVCCVGMASGLDSLAALRVVSPVLGSPRFNGVGALTAGSEAVMGRCSR